ncbi:tetratricopeptide repeat protein [Anaeromyxobacter oryzisoli]|uniref:tetratricopeptide repeat protein n=1 Tax=Anaeromyxobacter oryzisoli TaxID=2925408 RepID=UPI001F596605|nr:tetratricopeptide repeat protein [Anaeromyxobacter sp. SG63]
MKLVSSIALVLLAGCATGGPRPEEHARPRQDLVPVSRALLAIDAADRKDDIAAQRARWSQAADAAPRDPVPRFLAISAQPPGEDRWEEFKNLAATHPDSALGQLGMARTYVSWNTLDQADRAVVRALELEPDNWLAVLARAQVSERRERLEAAAADYRVVLSADPANPDAHLGLARVARAAGDLQQAESEAIAALKAEPDLFGAYALLGELASSRDDAVTAADYWTGAVEASPRDRNARVTLARLLEKRGDAAGAAEQWKAAVALKEDPDALAALAHAARAVHDQATEQRALERLSAVDPSAGEWRRIAEIRLASQDFDGAEKALRRALGSDPRDAQANLALGRVHSARGDLQQALEAFRAAGEPGRAERETLERRLNIERVARPDVNQLQRAVQALVDRTYRARLAEAPSLSGALRLRVTADAAGAATLVEVLEDSVHDPDVRACAYWNLKDASYPPNRPGRYAFTFAFRR